MNKKQILLSLALILPVIVFIFLKFFGKNKFDIPLYYKNGVDSLAHVCEIGTSKPYQLSDSALRAINWKGTNPILITVNPSPGEIENFRHVYEEIDQVKVSSIYLSEGEMGMSKENIDQWVTCICLLKKPRKTVLVDNQKHIRGYYNLPSREETDRLIVELQVLLQQ